MALQASRFTMIGLGVQNDAPPDPIQPKLVDGVHLRWAFQRELGFPWYGFSLFRRLHGKGKPVCLGQVMKPVTQPFSTLGSRLPIPPLGMLISDRPLRLTDDFAAVGAPEFDLAQRRFLRFEIEPAHFARRVQCVIGFRGEAPRVKECVGFLRRQPDQQKNPRREGNLAFEVHDAAKALAPSTRVRIVPTTAGQLSGLDCGYTLTVTLPAEVDWVDLTLTHFAGPALLEAVDRTGARVVSASMQSPARTPERIMLRARGIRSILVLARQNETFLHEICFGKGDPLGGPRTSLRLVANMGPVRVAGAVATGRPGDVVTVDLEADAISRIEIEPGNAALIDLCLVPITQAATQGWEPLQGFPYALSLPVFHPSYPASGNRPVNASAARATGLARILYGSPAPWTGSFADLHTELVRLVENGPGGTPMANVLSPEALGVPEPPDLEDDSPTMQQRPTLDAILFAALNPAAAQMLGLYWVDRTAVPGTHYDYLAVANYRGAGHGSAATTLAEIATNEFLNLDGYIVFDKVVAPAPPLARPTDVRAYALPGSWRVRADGTGIDASNNAGLRWHIPTAGTTLVPGAALMYHVWRASLGNTASPATSASFTLLTDSAPQMVTESILSPGETPTRADDWPPFALHFQDNGLAEGWYRYRVAGLDIFGRLSQGSDSAKWYQWAPVPEPRPWYYVDPPVDREIHPSAVRLLDKIPPPPPTGIEAYALDPDDPFLLEDAAYAAWKATLSTSERDSLIGLRVQWQWTQAHMREAPDTNEFRIYYQAGRLNALAGTVTAVVPASSGESNVTTDIVNTHGADAYAGAHLRIGSDAYPIVGSSPDSPLQLRVRDLGLTETAGTVSVVSGSATVTGTGTAWHAGMTNLQFQVAGEVLPSRILAIASPTQLTLDSVYTGGSGAGKVYAIFDRRPRAPSSASVVIPAVYAAGSVTVTNGSAIVTGAATAWRAAMVGQIVRIEGDPTAYRVQTIVSAAKLTLDKPFAGPTAAGKTYAIAFPTFTDYATTTNWQQRYYVVGYDEHVTETTDDDGAPLRKYAVLLPAAGDADRAGVPLATSLAEPIAYAHIGVSAADDKVHTADAAKWAGTAWGNRTGNEGDAGAPAAIYLVRRVPPDPPAPPAPDSDRVYATPADYHGHSYYTYRWVPQANLKTHVFRALDDAIFKTDWAKRPRTALSATQLEVFPSEAAEPGWNAAKRAQIAAALNALNGPAADPRDPVAATALYRALSNDALRVLAGLPGNERAFVQLTITPLDPADPANADRRGPDNDAGYAPSAALRAYLDELDGRSTNRYFYRAAYVDAANNRSALGISGPPVWLPNVVAPRAPVITKVLGGERQITLKWASNREADLAEYRVFRAASADDARDLRRMTQLYVEVVPAGEPSSRPAEISWIDNVRGLVTFYYRLVAVDEDGNVSDPSVAFAGRAFDESLPVPPVPTVEWVERNGITRAEISWESDGEALLQRRDIGASVWVELTHWRAPGSHIVRDPFSVPEKSYDYRVRSRKLTGAVALGAPVTLEHE